MLVLTRRGGLTRRDEPRSDDDPREGGGTQRLVGIASNESAGEPGRTAVPRRPIRPRPRSLHGPYPGTGMLGGNDSASNGGSGERRRDGVDPADLGGDRQRALGQGVPAGVSPHRQ